MTSSAVPGESQEATASVFDFLYVDQGRIGLFATQFTDFGHLTEIVHRRGATSSFKVEAGVAGIAKGGADGSETGSVERSYDTQWTEVLNFLDEVQTRGMLRERIDEAPLGSLILASGQLHIVNMQPLGGAFGAMSATLLDRANRPAAARGNRRNRRAARQDPAVDDPDQDGFGLRMLAALDHPVFSLLEVDGHRIWAMLNPDFLVGGAADLNLKHGIRVSGNWHVLGIVDCEPGTGEVLPFEVGRICGADDNTFSDAAITMTHEFRNILGRPSDCWGITPLLIMRPVG